MARLTQRNKLVRLWIVIGDHAQGGMLWKLWREDVVGIDEVVDHELILAPADCALV